jgi:FKBP-type peptidyl-prolyl cis-trans isomerase
MISYISITSQPYNINANKQMKNQKLITIVIGILVLIGGYIAGSFFPMKETLKIGNSVSLKTEMDSFSYAYGLYTGGGTMTSLKQILTDEVFPKEGFIKGVKDGLYEKKDIMDPMAAQSFLQGFAMKQQGKMQERATVKGETNLADGKAFLETNRTREGVTTTASGLQYEVLAKGNGISPSSTDSVTVHYTGTLLDGTVFDSSVERGEPVTFKLNQVIPGWTEGLQLMKEGDKFKFYIPSEIAYGQRGGRSIEPNSTLIFEVELLHVIKVK